MNSLLNLDLIIRQPKFIKLPSYSVSRYVLNNKNMAATSLTSSPVTDNSSPVTANLTYEVFKPEIKTMTLDEIINFMKCGSHVKYHQFFPSQLLYCDRCNCQLDAIKYNFYTSDDHKMCESCFSECKETPSVYSGEIVCDPKRIYVMNSSNPEYIMVSAGLGSQQEHVVTMLPDGEVIVGAPSTTKGWWTKKGSKLTADQMIDVVTFPIQSGTRTHSSTTKSSSFKSKQTPVSDSDGEFIPDFNDIKTCIEQQGASTFYGDAHDHYPRKKQELDALLDGSTQPLLRYTTPNFTVFCSSCGCYGLQTAIGYDDCKYTGLQYDVCIPCCIKFINKNLLQLIGTCSLSHFEMKMAPIMKTLKFLKQIVSAIDTKSTLPYSDLTIAFMKMRNYKTVYNFHRVDNGPCITLYDFSEELPKTRHFLKTEE